ncbi:hypothetical protein QYM36_009330 [Artemia franciscana]|uniref:Uncharacterized protein n=1 Tax=Artemia franciscana TaxID=6661 RepID=A0AA88HLJ6_ARTSF|nr:hypothetical protein QYM36_009330 [Artemia franciscana]KAK2713424.1 hypothetical protein QYM36_009330 [Artemia franciscana]KAK2713425.1 hypothetical protein QYM36_009330 [Artemia franciscana]
MDVCLDRPDYKVNLFFEQPSMNWDGFVGGYDGLSRLKKNWEKFENHARALFQGPLSKESKSVKCGFILVWVGDTGRDIFHCRWNNLLQPDYDYPVGPEELLRNFRLFINCKIQRYLSFLAWLVAIFVCIIIILSLCLNADLRRLKRD